MKFFLLPIALSASLAAAQASSACGADYIVETCLSTENAKFAACNTNDWDCKCSSYEAIMTCFNNCPNDSRRASQQGQKDIFCGYASQYPSKKTSVAANTATATAAPGAATTAAGGSPAAGTTGTSTGAAAPAKTNGAADLAMNAGGVLAAVAAVVAAAL